MFISVIQKTCCCCLDVFIDQFIIGIINLSLHLSYSIMYHDMCHHAGWKKQACNSICMCDQARERAGVGGGRLGIKVCVKTFKMRYHEHKIFLHVFCRNRFSNMS